VVGSHHLPGWLDSIVKHVAGGAGKMQIAGMAAIGFVLIAAISGIASYVENYYTESVGQWVAHDLRLRTYHHLQRLSLSYYESHQVGVILSTLTTGIATIQSFASSGTLGMLVDLFTIVGMLGLMLWLNFDFALVAIAVMPFLLLFVFRFKKAIKKATKEVRKNQSEIVTVAEQGLESERVAFGTQMLEETHLKEVSAATVQSALKARQVKALLSPVVSIMTAACVALVLWRGAGLILAGAMTAGVLTIFLSYLNKFFKPVQDLAKMTTTIAQTAVGVERIRAILEADDMIAERDDAFEPKTLGVEIVFDHVAFGYGNDTPVLRDVNFVIKKGQMVGIVGPTGSGKSTVVSLIPRFYDSTAGTVTIDGTDIRNYTLAGLRQHIGFVLQDTVLFRGTIAENIAYGRPGSTRDEIVHAAVLANADEFIEKMPQGFDTPVGDRGLTLSGGQRQRIGIARAIIRDTRFSFWMNRRQPWTANRRER
jgi:ABC-type multidrug transport system fused ATPase/permease subunit